MTRRVSPYFDKLDFPDYEFREFPQMLYSPDGRSIVVSDEKEKAALDGEWFPSPTAAKQAAKQATISA